MAGWQIGYSLPTELDFALHIAAHREQYMLANMQPETLSFYESVSSDWRAEWLALAKNFDSVNLLCSWARTTFEGDFRRATLPARDLTLADAIAVRREQLRDYGQKIEVRGTPLERLTALEQALNATIFGNIGRQYSDQGIFTRRVVGEVEQTVQYLKDGKHHSAFWFLLDRFYYEYYLPWRNTRLAYMEAQANRAAIMVGGQANSEAVASNTLSQGKGSIASTLSENRLSATTLQNGASPIPQSAASVNDVQLLGGGVIWYGNTIPDTTWLPRQNQLRTAVGIQESLKAGALTVFFWVEPFELFDTSFSEPGVMAVSFAEAGQSYDNFRTYIDSLASRAQAFSDPTRVFIMRIIRNFTADNTTISNYIGVSRPTVSEHARILREAGFIRTYQEGRQARHEVVPEEVAKFFQDLKEFLDLDI